ncbi:MAG: DNA-3-methyladenine glycosylase 2 family protein [Clostridia bacterium]|nr:DNA-3-methyladenine glycosylase 2 family protein [Clostridia bacterium]
MKYLKEDNCIKVFSKDEFNPEHIFECGQIFSYEKQGKDYIVYASNKMAKVEEREDYYCIFTNHVDYFVNFFDLNTNYSNIKKQLLSQYPMLNNAIQFGYGMRILKHDYFETIISFIVSANNNIKRIQKILFGIRQKYGTWMNGYYAFPTVEQLLDATEADFKALGAGYRAKYLCEAVKYLNGKDINQYAKMSTPDLNKDLLNIMGVGQKVADCIMLFAFSRQDVFPVDTWIEKVYCAYFNEEHNRGVIRKNLVSKFGNMSGYAQQYLFYFQRSDKHH